MADWNETFQFLVQFPEIAILEVCTHPILTLSLSQLFVQFRVYHHAAVDISLGHYHVPVHCLRPGHSCRLFCVLLIFLCLFSFISSF